jgi:hypothetical protein
MTIGVLYHKIIFLGIYLKDLRNCHIPVIAALATSVIARLDRAISRWEIIGSSPIMTGLRGNDTMHPDNDMAAR